MKIRSDFVTNSSSSSFILARKGELNERQRLAIADFIASRFLGTKRLSPGDTKEDVQQFAEQIRASEDETEQMHEALAQCLTIYGDTVDFEMAVYDFDLAEFYTSIWEIVETNAEEGTFRAIDDDLRY